MWSLKKENEETYGGILIKKDYEKMMTLSPETVIDIGIASKLKDISFNDDIDTLKKYCENEHYFSDEDIEYFDLINADAFASIK